MDFSTTTQCTNDYADVPSNARFSVSPEAAHEIIMLSELVKKNGLYKLEKFETQCQWFNDGEDTEPVRMEAQTLSVSTNEFWYSAFLKHTDILVETSHEDIDKLKASLAVCTA